MIKKAFKNIIDKATKKEEPYRPLTMEEIRQEFDLDAEREMIAQAEARKEMERKRIPKLNPKWEDILMSKETPLTQEESLYLDLRNHVKQAVTFQNQYFIDLLLQDGFVDFSVQRNDNPRAYTYARRKLADWYEYEPIFAIDLREGLMNEYPLFRNMYRTTVPNDQDKLYAVVFSLNGTEGHAKPIPFYWFERLNNAATNFTEEEKSHLRYIDIRESHGVFDRPDVILFRDRITTEDLVEVYHVYPGEYYFEKVK